MKEGVLLYNFASHPKTRQERVAFQAAHNFIILWADLFASIALLLIAIFEIPTLNIFQSSDVIRGVAAAEIICLCLCSINVMCSLAWAQWKSFLTSVYLFAIIFWFDQFFEALVVLGRGETHFRITRCFRPIFFILSPLATEVKAIFVDLLRSLKPIAKMMILLAIFILVFSIFGFYWFGLCERKEKGLYVQHKEDWYFHTFGETIVNLFVLVTTANFPDIAMPSLKKNSGAFLFFVVYLLIGVYFVANVILAAVSERFSFNSKADAKRKYLHKREGLRRAFEILDADETGTIDYNTFQGVLLRWNRFYSSKQILLCFKALDRKGQRRLALEEWYEVYNILCCSWHLKKSRHYGLFSEPNCHSHLKTIGRCVRKLSRSRYFIVFMYGIVVFDVILQIALAVVISKSRENCIKGGRESSQIYLEAFLHVSLAVYVIEALIKFVGQGFHYFTIAWNDIEFLLVVLNLLAFSFPGMMASSTMRSLRLFRLFNVSKTFRDTTSSMLHITPKMVRFLVAVLCVYYLFAIIGMEVFGGKVSLCGCTAVSHNSTVLVGENGTLTVKPISPVSYGCSDEQFLRLSPEEGSLTTVLFPNATGGLSECKPKSALECLESGGVDCDCRIVECGGAYSAYYDRTNPDGLYYLNNFDNIARAYSVLFELMIVNNWHVIMQGTTDAVNNEAARIYFFVFYIVTTIVLTNVVVAFVVAAFNSLFPMLIENRRLKKEEKSQFAESINTTVERRDRQVYYKISVSEGELKLVESIKKADVKFSYDGALDTTTGKRLTYKGKRRLEAIDVYHVLYRDEIKSWEKVDDGDAVDAARGLTTEEKKRRRARQLWKLVKSKLGSRELRLRVAWADKGKFYHETTL
ncbi:two pore calcium channel protein 1-like isoform X2 [Oscarella lobularis]